MKEHSVNQTQLSNVLIDGESYFKISHVDEMRPFFMSIVSDSNHWMFISSNGGLSAGRKDADNALFPYYTDDKITESAEITGSKSLFRIQKNGQAHLWEPFSIRAKDLYNCTRNLYKSIHGNKIIFEEINQDLSLIFRYQWNSSDRFGFVKKSTLLNLGDGEIAISILDGIQNIMPYGVNSALQKQSSNLVDAYKRNELEKNTGLGIYALSAIIVDKAEPSEALKANIAWSAGIDNPKYLLSSLQLDRFRMDIPIVEEKDIKAEKGAYFICFDLVLRDNNSKDWMIVADVNKNHSAIVETLEFIKKTRNVESAVQDDIERGTVRLISLVAAADGLQLSADNLRDARHYSNTLFNIMRGGIFDDNYQIEKSDFATYLSKANKHVFSAYDHLLLEHPETFSLAEFRQLVNGLDDLHFKRLCLEYLPLKFSRRHGDPSRPWNRFSINTKNEIDGSKILDYEGNWRDIFQNWEALAYSYPEFAEGMVHKFLNASTFDGYNPYRITKGGIDWEVIEPDDPWSYIGYWGDHQIIYLLKLLELLEGFYPGKLAAYFDEDLFVFANVPYRIKSYKDILKNPKDTIEFDHKADRLIRDKMSEIGADGALLADQNGSIINVNIIEKILVSVLAKISNFIPEGGIWMNTQRPEWNDANNALVGNGVSMVTLYYLRRFLEFFKGLLENSDLDGVSISSEVYNFYTRIHDALARNEHCLTSQISDPDRKLILDDLGKAGSIYRQSIYEHSFGREKRSLPISDLLKFTIICLRYLEHSIRANKREDNLYHAYNLMTIEKNGGISISHLSEMLEGQVAVLSSGHLSSDEVLELLDSLKNSALFRKDQASYLLYPAKQLPGFIEKNNIPKEKVHSSTLLTQLISDENTQIIEKDINHEYHFSGNFKNALDLERALNVLLHSQYAPYVEKDKQRILEIFEEEFNHKAFTGRSGTFYGYEGLGSIYWHMVSKLQLAVLECCLEALKKDENDELLGRLIEHYYEINEGIGVHKSPEIYGAFPTDPYSHTPAGKGAQQPGMTGQVKEDILSRFGELGVLINDGKLHFNPRLLRREEFLSGSKTFRYVDVHSYPKEIHLEKDTLGFTYCQIPVIYRIDTEPGIEMKLNDNGSKRFATLSLDNVTSKEVFERAGNIVRIIVNIEESMLR